MNKGFDEYYKDCKPMEGKMKHKVIKCEICHNHSYANLYLKAIEIAMLMRGLDEETKNKVFMEAGNILSTDVGRGQLK